METTIHITSDLGNIAELKVIPGSEELDVTYPSKGEDGTPADMSRVKALEDIPKLPTLVVTEFPVSPVDGTLYIKVV